MNPNKQRIAIAEACRWTRQSDDSVWFDDPTNSFQVHEQDIPDYVNDLNDMHEAEKYLVDNHTSRDFQTARYINHLENIVSYNVRDVGWSFALTTATAAQKAKAFLKTIGKWEE